MNYQYEVIDQQGKVLKGKLESETEREAIRALGKKGLQVTDIHVVNKQPLSVSVSKAAVKHQELILVFHELATMLKAGVSIVDAVDSQLESEHKPVILDAFDIISTNLKRGESFSKSIEESQLKLPKYFFQLISSGELTGKVAEALTDAVAQMDYENKLRKEFKSALIYPSILVFSGVGAVLLMFIFVVPKFANLLDSSVDLPFLAYAVLSIGTWSNDNWWAIAIAGIFITLGLIAIFKNETLKSFMLDRVSHWPIIGAWIIEAETARWSKVLGALLSNRVPLIKALELAQSGVEVEHRRGRLEQVTRAVRAGSPLSAALKEFSALTATGYNLLKVGEKTGELPMMLGSLATLYEESGRNRMKSVLALIEPLAILIIGSVIGVIIMGVVLAITSANDIVL